MSDWFERINGHYGSNTVWDTQKAGGANESSGAQQSPRVVGAGNSDDDYVETDFEDDSVNNLGSEYHTYDELQTMYDSKQEEVTSAEGEVNKWQDNSQNGIADAEAAYDEAVQNDKEISDELKKDQAENSKAITAKENEISEKESKITTLEGDISDCELNIEHIDAQKSKIQVLLDSLPAVKTSQTKEEWQQIEEQKSDYETQIENADRELYLEKTKKERFEGELETAKSEKETLDGELDKLNEVKDGIDEKIRESCSQETKDLQKALNDLKVEVEQNKTTAQTSLDSRRSELQEIANYMNNHASLKTDDISTDPVPNAASEAGSMLNGQKEMSFDDFNTLYGDEFYETVGDYYLHDGEWCADTVTLAMSRAYGGIENVPGNFNEDCDEKYNCWGLANWARDNNALMDEREDPDSYDISRLKPGDLILYNASSDGSYKHVGMVDYVDENGIIHTIEGNTSREEDDYYGSSGFLTRHIDANDHDRGYGISFVLVNEMEENDRKSK